MTATSPLERRVAEVRAYAASYGWETTTIDLDDVEALGLSEAVGVGGVRRDGLDGGATEEWSFLLAFGVRSGATTRRVLVLRTEADDFAVEVTLEGSPPETWGSRRASAWRDALADPARFCGYPHRCPVCSGSVVSDLADGWVCAECGDEWPERP